MTNNNPDSAINGRPVLSGSYSLSATGYLRTVAGDATPFAINTKLKDYRLKKAHEIERDGLLDEIENLTRQRSELLCRAHDHETELQRERCRRKKAEARLKELRARSSEAIADLVAKQEAVMKELEKANKLLAVMSPVIYSDTENKNEHIRGDQDQSGASMHHNQPSSSSPKFSTQDSFRNQFGTHTRPHSANYAVGSGTKAAARSKNIGNMSTLEKDKYVLCFVCFYIYFPASSVFHVALLSYNRFILQRKASMLRS
jgi:hypothetical protein